MTKEQRLIKLLCAAETKGIGNIKKGMAKAKLHWLRFYKIKLNCHICKMGFTDCPELCQFHHTDPKPDDRSISRLRTCIKEIILKEMKKCIVLCSNCHDSVHFGNGIALLGRNV